MRNAEFGVRFNPYKHAPAGAIIPCWLCPRPEVSIGGKVIYGKLVNFAGPEGYAYPHQEQIAHEVALQQRQVRRYIDELVEHRLIDIERVPPFRRNQYFFLTHPWMGKWCPGPVRYVRCDRSDVTGPNGSDLPEQNPNTTGQICPVTPVISDRLERSCMSGDVYKEENLDHRLDQNRADQRRVAAARESAAKRRQVEDDIRRIDEIDHHAVGYFASLSRDEQNQFRDAYLATLPEGKLKSQLSSVDPSGRRSIVLWAWQQHQLSAQRSSLSSFPVAGGFAPPPRSLNPTQGEVP